MDSNTEAVPTTYSALIQDGKGVLTLRRDVPIPGIGVNEVLVKVSSVALNATDFKMPARFTSPGAKGGCDFAGTIVASSESSLKAGARVCGCVHGSDPLDHASGSFGEYVRANAGLVWQIPNNMSFESASAIGGVGHITSALTFWDIWGLKGTPEQPIKNGPPVLVYAGSTATGTMALQMLKLSGYRTLTTCSPHNFELVRSYGADECFDYSSPSCIEDIKTSTGGRLQHALDCIGDELSVSICYGSLARLGGRYVTLENVPAELLAKRKAVKAEFLMAYDQFGHEVGLSGGYERPPNPRRHEAAKRQYVAMTALASSGRIRPHPVRVLEGGLAGVQAGLGCLRKGQVSGEKLVVPV